jgi:hypothetical protein
VGRRDIYVKPEHEGMFQEAGDLWKVLDPSTEPTRGSFSSLLAEAVRRFLPLLRRTRKEAETDG